MWKWLKGKAEITKEKQRGNRLKNDNSYLDTCDLCKHSTDWTCDFMLDCKGEGCSKFEPKKVVTKEGI